MLAVPALLHYDPHAGGWPSLPRCRFVEGSLTPTQHTLDY
jgi:hypothetical protein